MDDDDLLVCETLPLLLQQQTNDSRSLTNLCGLTSSEAAARLVAHGANALPDMRVPLWKRLGRHLFMTPISLLIWAAVIVSALVRDWIDFGLVLALQLGNTALSFHESAKAEKALEALRSQIAPRACCLRDGHWAMVAAETLVPGDVVRFGIGDLIAADLVVAARCQVDESSLTGESLPVNRERGEPVYAGSFCTKGAATALVCETGVHTKFGRQHALMASVRGGDGHFERVLRRISYTLLAGSALVIVAIVVMQFATLRRTGLAGAMDVANLALVLLIAALPVALQAVSTTTMALAARRLAADGVICSKLSAIQDLACMTCLCSDKTGTLTLNKLALRTPWLNGDTTDAQLLLAAALASDYTAPHCDAIDACIVEGVAGGGAAALGAHWEQLEFVPFEPALKRCEATVRDRRTGAVRHIVKGAPLTLLAVGRIDEHTAQRVRDAVDALAARGFRSIGVMSKSAADASHTFDGIVSLYDPPRQDALQVVAAIRALGVDVKMVSGDHGAIVKETCAALGMLPVVLHNDNNDGAGSVQDANAFAEVFPENKFRIVEQLQSLGTVVAMTGDGLNDAAALRRADIGIAVHGASDAARGASDLALSQPGLAPIVTAIVRARQTFERLRNYISFRIAISINVLLSSLLLLAIYDFQLPPLAIVLHIILMDATVLMTAKDRVEPSVQPCQWRLGELATVSSVVGLLSVFEVLLVYWLARSSALFYSDALSREELRALVYLALAMGSQLTIFVVRTRTLFFARRPGVGLVAAVAVSAVVATLVSVFCNESVMVGFRGVVAADAACTVCVVLVAFLVKDVVKFAVLAAFERVRDTQRASAHLKAIMATCNVDM